MMEAEHLRDLQQLQTYLSQPALGAAAITVELSEATVDDDRLRHNFTLN